MSLKESLKPSWRKMLLFLVSYPIAVGIMMSITMRINILEPLFETLFISSILPFLVYYLSCKIEPTIFKKEQTSKITIWEIGMLAGIFVGAMAIPLAMLTPYPYSMLFVAPTLLLISLLSALPLVGDVLFNIPCWFLIPICGDEGGMAFFFIVAPVISGLIMGGIIGFIINAVYISYKKFKSKQARD